jgi:endonuclease/exonuclease/phosphatase (EEP) superfamily protein YafD
MRGPGRALYRGMNGPSPRRHGPDLPAAAIAVAVIGLAVVTLAAWLPSPWPLSLAEHFHVQYLVMATALAVLATAVGRGWLADVALITALGNLIAVAPHLAAAPAVTAAADAVGLRVLVVNVHTSSTSHDRVRALIDDLDPDLIALVEVDRRWLVALEPSLRRYPGRVEEPRSDNFGVALYHRRPLRNGRIAYVGGILPSIVARLDLGTTEVTAIVTHPIPPMTTALAADNARQLAAIGDLAAPLAGPRIVVGDLNATPWSRPFARLVARSGLRDSRAGFGIGASFPASPPSLAALRIPIDHALVSADIAVTDRRVERDVGSDHLPLYLELAIAAPRR